MIKKELKVELSGGLHAYNVNELRRIANDSSSQVFLRNAKGMANSKDMIALLALNIKQNDLVEVFVDGIDEEEVMRSISLFFQQ